jgi:hypothetical protein
LKQSRHYPRLAIAITAIMALGITATPAFAHHSFALFDREKKVKLVGQVKDFQWTNPHIWIQLLVKDDKGAQTEWSIEGASLNSLVRAGWKRNSVKNGDAVEVMVNPARDGTALASLVTLSVNGKIVGKPGAE